MSSNWLVYTSVIVSLLFAPLAFSEKALLPYIECTPNQIFMCEAGSKNCNSIPVVDIDGVYLLKINIKKKFSETYVGANKISESKIDRVESHSGLLFLHGFKTAEESENVHLAHSWSAVIDMDLARLTVTSVASGFGVVLIGDCNVEKGEM